MEWLTPSVVYHTYLIFLYSLFAWEYVEEVRLLASIMSLR